MSAPTTPSSPKAEGGPSLGALWWAFLRLGCVSFGGPSAHIGFFQQDLVRRRHWLTDADYSDLVALFQSLPGPSSSQVATAIGWRFHGALGGFLTWLAFTLPSTLLMIGAALAITQGTDLEIIPASVILALSATAVAVVGNALWTMASSLCPDLSCRLLALVAAGVALLPFLPPVAPIALGIVVGIVLWRRSETTVTVSPGGRPRIRSAALWLLAFTLVLALSLFPWNDPASSLAATLTSSGSLVFGGGHVVLPLLKGPILETGLVDPDQFLAGYGLVQAVPGPLFSYGAFLGVSAAAFTGNPILDGVLGLLLISLGGFLLVGVGLSLLEPIRRWRAGRAALRGANAAVVGLLAASLGLITFGLLWEQSLVLILIVIAGVGLGIWLLRVRRWSPVWLVALAVGFGLLSDLLHRSAGLS